MIKNSICFSLPFGQHRKMSCHPATAKTGVRFAARTGRSRHAGLRFTVARGGKSAGAPEAGEAPPKGFIQNIMMFSPKHRDVFIKSS
jgi:hypothetical protein